MQALLINRFNVVVASIVLIVTMFLPMIAIRWFGAELRLNENATAEITVGIAVILRATSRRLMRGVSTNIMRTTVGAFGRTSARTVTRRVVKFTSQLLLSSIVQDSVDESEKAKQKPERHSWLTQSIALVLGFGGLCLSFLGVLHVISAEHVDALIGSKGLSEWEAVLLAGLPLPAYALLHKLFGKSVGVQTVYRTEFDGLLLQGYFTGAGSFLPLTTDVEYHGSDKGKCRLATSSLLGMLILFGLFSWIGVAIDSPQLSFLGSMFLVYSFVYCFPIKPLEGHYIWASSKLLWALISLPILLAFMISMDKTFGQIL